MADLNSGVSIVRPGQNLQAGAVDALFIEEFAGMVEGTIAKKSVMESWLNWRPVRGTNQLTNFRVGSTELGKLVPGAAPNGSPADFSDVSLKVDTVILARNSVFTLDDIQNSFDAKMELATEQGKTVAKFMDQVGLIKLMKAARITNMTSYPKGWQPGTITTLAGALDELDSTKFERSIEDTIQAIQEKDIDPEDEEFVIYVKPAQYFALLRNDKLIDSRFSDNNGNYSDGKVMKSCGLRIVKTNRIVQSAITGHELSNAGNNNGYDVSAAEAKAVALIGSPRSVLAGSTIPLTVEVWWDKASKCWFIDSFFALGATENNPAFASVINKA